MLRNYLTNGCFSSVINTKKKKERKKKLEVVYANFTNQLHMIDALYFSDHELAQSGSHTRSLSVSDLSLASILPETINETIVNGTYDRNLNRESAVNRNHAGYVLEGILLFLSSLISFVGIMIMFLIHM